MYNPALFRLAEEKVWSQLRADNAQEKVAHGEQQHPQHHHQAGGPPGMAAAPQQASPAPPVPGGMPGMPGGMPNAPGGMQQPMQFPDPATGITQPMMPPMQGGGGGGAGPGGQKIKPEQWMQALDFRLYNIQQQLTSLLNAGNVKLDPATLVLPPGSTAAPPPEAAIQGGTQDPSVQAQNSPQPQGQAQGQPQDPAAAAAGGAMPNSGMAMPPVDAGVKTGHNLPLRLAAIHEILRSQAAYEQRTGQSLPSEAAA